jgi:hypothetical protein
METFKGIIRKEMTRKEFMVTIGFALASLFGLADVLHFIFGQHVNQAFFYPVSHGYGSKAYGGQKLNQ